MSTGGCCGFGSRGLLLCNASVLVLSGFSLHSSLSVNVSLLLFPSGLRDDMASSSTFTLEDSAICLTSEQSTMDVDVDMDRDDGSVLDVYLVRTPLGSYEPASPRSVV